MATGTWYWIILVIFALFGGWSQYPFEKKSSTWIVALVLFALLGWKVFGSIVQ